MEKFDHQNWSDFFCVKSISFARLNSFLYCWVFKCQISACRFLYADFYFLLFVAFFGPVILQRVNTKQNGRI